MAGNHWQPYPVERARRYLEPGPVVLVSSAWAGGRNVMTLGWHTVMEFSPALVGCMISAGNHSFGLIREAGECVINLPTLELLDAVVGVGNTTGASVDKFERFGLTPASGEVVAAPLIRECHAAFECRLAGDRLVPDYNFFVWEIVRAWVKPAPAWPRTVHYTGDGVFMVSGGTVDRSADFRAEMLLSPSG
ncbi:flavin reductase family protein [Arhodomonas aquaeolei]|uniref:flavin reductase family protein n=1 Tax=Arhodomonas aquaeolei TaxID=2369 RepID=UPI00039B88F6|nr:flavin reductase family protein [Arhodomonas aquaeolei]MCS4504537.1 flavin reductase family protein [Arhodomonas aquaeolei]